MNSTLATFKKFPRTFWIANTIELFERWAWYGFFMLFANYLTGSTDDGGLQFSQAQKGTLMGVGTGILYFLPVITGAIADKFGYRRVLALAFLIYASAFVLLPHFNSFTGVFIMYLYLAVGAALFKPVISATIAKTTTDETSTIGFGNFYMMVNIGAFLGPMLTLIFKNSSYDLVFYISAGMISVNFILLLFYREPNRIKTDEPLIITIKQVFINIYKVFLDYKFVIFLIIASGFWTMYLQLFFTLPVFISQWVDTSGMYQYFSENMPLIAENYGHNGVMEAEFITNFDALFIIAFQIVISSLVMRWKALSTMVGGFIIATLGLSLSFFTQDVTFIVVAIFIFSIGEMSASPKITEYIGRIAPSDKKALYMGYSFIPLFLGNIFAGIVSGTVYQDMSDKHTLLLKEVNERGLQISTELSHNEYFSSAAEQLNMSNLELTNYLWMTYNPSQIWWVIAAIGGGAAIALALYNQFMFKKN
ncbi:MAG: MFS transporter [Bacteroidales bacterium]|jgi:POT family proton-dependent oligopeptide transporter|nr:MFS transporter [Bacteroidales bacterium]